jgi:preprotein translocase subunit YajC
MSFPLYAVLAMAQPAGGEKPNFLVQLAPLILIFVIFYFLLIAPARRKQKKHTEMLGNLKSGDKVVTSGGVYATVVGVTEQVVQLRIADGVKIEVAKHAIAGMQPERGE